MAIGSWQNLAKAKFMNLNMDYRPIEHKPSTKVTAAHIDEMLPWDNQKKHISIKRLLKLFTIHLSSPTLIIVLLYGGLLQNSLCWHCKSCQIEQARIIHTYIYFI